MKDLEKIKSCKHLQNELTYFNQENSSSHGFENVSIIIVNKNTFKNIKKHHVFMLAQQPRTSSRLSRSSKSKKHSSITRHSSMPELNKCTRPVTNKKTRENETKLNKFRKSPFQSKFIINIVSEHRIAKKKTNSFNYPRQTKLKIYRCQQGPAQGSCCCSCNSDAMFKVMKGLYDCYKAKNCDNCDCILCGNLRPDQRKKKSITALSEKARLERAKDEGLVTPLTGKTPEQKERILQGLAKKCLPLPEGKTPSEKKLIDKVRAYLGLPKEPKNKAETDKYDRAASFALLLPLDGLPPEQTEMILKRLHDLGIPLPEGRTPSEKSLIAKVAASSYHPPKVSTLTKKPSAKLRRAKEEGLLTPLTGKTPEQKERILQGLAKECLPLPEGKTPSEKKLFDKVRAYLGLPKEPKNKAETDKHEKAAKTGKLLPLEEKTPAQKENILKRLHDLGIPLPEGRKPSEKSLISKVAASSYHPPKVSTVTKKPSAKLRRAKEEGLLTPLTGKTPEQKERILQGLAKECLPLPEGKTASEKKLFDKVRAYLGLPKEPKNKAETDKHEKAAKTAKLLPLEEKTPAQKENILKGLHDLGISLPEGRTPSEKSLIAKVAASSYHPPKVSTLTKKPSAKLRRAKEEGLLTPLTGKTPEQKERILQGLAKKCLPLPEGKTASEKKLIDKVRAYLSLPKEPKNKAENKREKADSFALLLPLDGLPPEQTQKILKRLHDLGIPLPEGRTPSEKSLIAKVAASSYHPPKVSTVTKKPSAKLRRAKEEGLLTPLTGKTPEQKQRILQGLAKECLPLPEGKTASEKKLFDKVRAYLGLPKEPKNKAETDKHEKAAKTAKLLPLEEKTPAQKENILKRLHDLGISLPEGRTPSEKSLIAKVAASSYHPPKVSTLTKKPSAKLRRAKEEGLLTPLTGKTPEQKERILQGLAKKCLPLPEGKTASEKKLIDKVRAYLSLPKEPKNKAENKREKAASFALLLPLDGLPPEQTQKILKRLHDLGIPLPEGRTPSEKSLIAKVAASSYHPPKVSTVTKKPSAKLRRAKEEGLLTPLTGKTPEQKQRILQGLAKECLPLPEGKTASEKKLFDKVRAYLGLPKEPKNKAETDKHEKAARTGKLLPLEEKTPAQKENILKRLHDLGIPLPEGRKPSEKSLISKVAASSYHPPKVSIVTKKPSAKLRRAKEEGLLTPLTGKTPEQKERILQGLAKECLPLPEGKTASEKKLFDKVRAYLGLPKEPKNKAETDKHEKAAKTAKLLPLEEKTPAQKENILKGLHDLGIPLPEGRTPSEKSLIAKVAASSYHPPKVSTLTKKPSAKLRRAKEEGLLTPLTGKTPEQKERILQGLAKKCLPLPEGKTASEKKLIDKVRAYLSLPKEPKNKAENKHEKAASFALLLPLDGLPPEQTQKILKRLHYLGIPLPEGRTPSEKSLIAKVAASSYHPPKVSTVTKKPSAKLRRAKEEGLLTPLTGKTPKQKERILQGLAKECLPLPEGKTPSEKKLFDKVRAYLGLPKEPKNKAETDKHEKAAKTGKLLPLEEKTPAQKENILKGLHYLCIPLPEGRTLSEKFLIAKVEASSCHPPKVSTVTMTPSEKLRRAKAEGLLTPLTGKTPEQKEKILKGLAMAGLSFPESQTPSEKKLINKVCADLGLPKEPKTQAKRNKHEQAAKADILKPLEGKTPAQKKTKLKGLHDLGIALPEGRTPSEKSLIAKIAATFRPRSKVPEETHSEKLCRAKEKILKGLAIAGLPVPEGQTPPCKLTNKVRGDLCLPPSPKTQADKNKYEKLAKAGLLKPLIYKTLEEKQLKPVAADEQLEEMVKTTKCDRACGCTKKKIRFKHSYVKIRVTSPDISSFSNYPDEFFPGDKSRAFIESDGIKITVGRVIGIPSFTKSQTNHSYAQYGHTILSVLQKNNSVKDSSSVESCCSRPCSTESENIYLQSSTYEGRTSKSDRIVECLRRLKSFDIYRGITSENKSVESSLDSVLVINSVTSLCSTNASKSVHIISSMSIMESSISSSSTRYSDNQSTDEPLSSSLQDGPITSEDSIDQTENVGGRGTLRNIETVIPERENTISRLSPTKFNFGNYNMRSNKLKSKTEEPVVLFNGLQSELDVSKIMYKIMTNKRFTGASSIFIVVPVSDDDEDECFSDSLDSKTNIYASETSMIQEDSSRVNPNSTLEKCSFTTRNEQVCGKGKTFILQEITSKDTETMFQNESLNVLRGIDRTNDEICHIHKPNNIAQMQEESIHGIGTETTAEMPWCCRSKECSTPFIIQNCNSKDLGHYAANVMSEQKMLLDLKDKALSCHHLPDMRTPCSVEQSCPVAQSCDSPSVVTPGLFTSEVHDCSLLPLTTSTQLSDRLCCVSKSCVGPVRVPSLDPGSQPDRCRHSLHDPEPASPSTQSYLSKQTCTPYGLNSEHTLSENDIKGAGMVTDEMSDRQQYLQANRQLKMPKDSASEEDCESPCPCMIIEETKNQPSCCQTLTQEKPKYFSCKENCECQEKPSDSDNNGFCVYQDFMKSSESGSCFTTDPVSKRKNKKMTKLLSSVRKAICHKTDESSEIKGKKSKCKADESSEIKGKKTECKTDESSENKGEKSKCKTDESSEIIGKKSKCKTDECTEIKGKKSKCKTDECTEIKGKKFKCKTDECTEIKGKKSKCKTDKSSEIKGKKPKCKSLEKKGTCKCLEEKLMSNFSEEKVTCNSLEKICTCKFSEEKVKHKCLKEKCMPKFSDEEVTCKYLEKKYMPKLSVKKGTCKCLEEKCMPTLSVKKVTCKRLEEKGTCKCVVEKCMCKFSEEKVKCKCLKGKCMPKFSDEEVTCKYLEKKYMPKLSVKKGTCKCLEEKCTCKCVEEKNTTENFMTMTSQLSECTSVFQACKSCKKKKQQRIEELAAGIKSHFEAAVKYYVSNNPEQFWDLIQPLQSDQDKYQGKKNGERSNIRDKKNGNDNLKKSEKNQLKSSRECPCGSRPLNDAFKLIPEAWEELAKLNPKDKKLCYGGRGLALYTATHSMAGCDGVAGTAGRDVDTQIPSLDGVVESSGCDGVS